MTRAYSFPSLTLCSLFSFSSLSAPPPCLLSASVALLPALAVVELPAVASAGSQLAVLPSLQLVTCSAAAATAVPLPLLTSAVAAAFSVTSPACTTESQQEKKNREKPFIRPGTLPLVVKFGIVSPRTQ